MNTAFARDAVRGVVQYPSRARSLRREGVSVRHSMEWALPTRVGAVISLARNGTVVYNATIGPPSKGLLRDIRDHSYIANSSFISDKPLV